MPTDPTDAESMLFGDALACSVDLPAVYTAHAPEAGTVERAISKAESMLHAIARIEDSHGDEIDDSNGKDIALQRVEAKLDVLIDLVGKLARRGAEVLPLRRLRWSRRGVELHQPFETVAVERGFLLLQAVDWLPQPLELPVEQLASATDADGDQRIYLQFQPLPPGLESAIERHLFRLHRRQIAISRQK